MTGVALAPSGRERSQADAMDTPAITDQLAAVSLGGSQQTGANSSNNYSPSDASASASSSAENNSPPQPGAALVIPESQFCSACGKSGAPGKDLKKCAACMCVWYCGVACQRAHRGEHRGVCRRIATVLRERADGTGIRPVGAADATGSSTGDEGGGGDAGAAEVADPSLFAMPPKEECPLCMRVMPLLPTMKTYHACCGNTICCGCLIENRRVTHQTNHRNDLMGMPRVKESCPFCRTELPSDDDDRVRRFKERTDLGDAEAASALGAYYFHGLFGLPVDQAKGFALFHRAADLGSAMAQANLGSIYSVGTPFAPRDAARGRLYWEKAAKGGVVQARNALARLEFGEGNAELFAKHLHISAAMGCEDAANDLILCFENSINCIDHQDLAKSLQAKDVMCNEMRSEERDRAFLLMKEEEPDYFATQPTVKSSKSNH